MILLQCYGISWEKTILKEAASCLIQEEGAGAREELKSAWESKKEKGAS
jgi:hypothetical protein